MIKQVKKFGGWLGEVVSFVCFLFRLFLFWLFVVVVVLFCFVFFLVRVQDLV